MDQCMLAHSKVGTQIRDKYIELNDKLHQKKKQHLVANEQ